MQTTEEIEGQGFYSFRADANALGGFLEEPTRVTIPTLTPVSLPAVGGFTTARSEAFHLDDIVSCRSAYTRVSGHEVAGGGISILSTAVIEGLNLLEVVQAERIVAQLSILISRDGSALRVCTAGSQFEGLRLGGHRRTPRFSTALQNAEQGTTGQLQGATENEIRTIGNGQATRITTAFQNRYNATWATNRSQWLNGQRRTGTGCSLVDGFEEAHLHGCGHIVEIPGFGRIILGELFVTPYSAQLVALRAELGCPVKGKISINCTGGGGVHD